MKILLLLMATFSLKSFTQTMNYPELNVTPLASERIKIEAVKERKGQWKDYLWIQSSALMSVVSGAMATNSLKDDKDQADMAPTFSMAVGAFWLGATYWASKNYRPYRKAGGELKKYKVTSKREKLIRERMAEEEIKRISKIGTTVRWFSVVSNLAVAANLLDNVEGETDAQMITGFSVLSSLLPVFFKMNWENVSKEQSSYKKKIYGQISLLPSIYQSKNGDIGTGLNLTYSF